MGSLKPLRKISVVRPVDRLTTGQKTGGMRSARRVARYPLSTCVLLVVVGLGAWTTGRPQRLGELKRTFGFGWSDLVALRLYRLPTAIFIQTEPGIRGTVGLLLIFIPLAEWRLGSIRATIVLFLGDWISTVTVLCGLRLLAAAHRQWALVESVARDGGTSSAVHALAAAAILTIPAKRTRRVLGSLMVLEVVGLMIVRPELFDVQHGLASLAGWALGASFVRADRADRADLASRADRADRATSRE